MTAAGLRFRDLGGLRVLRHGEPVPLVGARLAAALSLLLAHAGERVPVDALAEAMWGDGARSRSPSTLDSHVWRLRRALEPDRDRGAPSQVLQHEDGGYRLVVAPEAIDSKVFAGLAEQARGLLGAGRAADAGRCATRALDLWRGQPWPALADSADVRAPVARLQETHDQLQEMLAEAELATGAPDRALLRLETALATNPLRERLWALRMLAQHRLGRPEEALRSYRRVRDLLLEELGLEPGAQLRELHARLLDGDPVLAGRVQEPVGPTEVLVRLPLATVAGAAGRDLARLAVEVARAVAPRLPDGVWFVDLTGVEEGVQDGVDLLPAVVSVPGPAPVADEQQAAPRPSSRARQVLLVLDGRGAAAAG